MKSFPFALWRSAAPIGAVFGLLTMAPAASHAEAALAEAMQDEYVFDSALFRGAAINQKALMRLSEGNDLPAGSYKVDLYVNRQFIENTAIQFIETEHHKVEPCFSPEQLSRASILIKKSAELHPPVSESKHCEVLEALVEHGSSAFDIGRLRLDLTIPQSLMKQIPRGYVSPEQLDDGASIGFINYLGNYYYNSYDAFGKSYAQDSAYAALNGGINFGKWQFRQQSSISHNDAGTEWRSIRSYVKRPLAGLQSELSIGQLSSTGRFFSGLSFNGMNISSDERMLPDSMRGYAPVIQGIAKTAAKVSIAHNGQEIYQATVAPGPFKISDLYPTSYSGDLEVSVLEADGSRSEFKVPFSAVPESVRQGAFKYNLDIGRTRDIGEDTNFANITAQYGLNNALTVNSGLRIADGYQSAMAGTAYTNFLGAFGTEATFSRAKLPAENYIDGWMFGANYSKTFQSTNTTIALAGYRFSTEGYRNLSDVISLRQSMHDGTPFQSSTYNEQSRATLVLNQSFGGIGTFYVSGSASRYRDEKPDDYQMQLGYGKSFSNGVSLNLSASRQKNAYAGYQYAGQNTGGASKIKFNQDSHTTFGLSVSIPLGRTDFAKDLLLNYTGDRGQNAYQASVNGSLGRIENLNYSLGLSYDDQSEISVWNASLNKRFNYANASLNASKASSYWQSSANIQGAAAIHSGGVTFGPYLSETFALIEAKGAYGARVLNAQGTKINKRGFALVPALTPYRYNTIALNPEGMPAQTELNAGDMKVAPYAGSAVKINFITRQGFAMLIQSKLQSGMAVPLGSEVLNENFESVGMTGQNGQIYARTDKKSGKLHIKWGDAPDDACFIDYQAPAEQLERPLIKFTEICKMEN